jgi:GNAT superfamily N-acetyltransferase
VSIRAASSTDGTVLAALNEFVHGLHVAARPDFFRVAPPDEAAAWLASLAEAPSSRIWIAEENGVPIGYVLVFFHERGERPFSHARRWCEIDQIAVDPRWRRKGTARALVETALEEARRRGISDIELSSWAFNTEAHAAFRRLGFTPKLIRFERMLRM